jgi:hypothetical protein
MFLAIVGIIGIVGWGAAFFGICLAIGLKS